MGVGVHEPGEDDLAGRVEDVRRPSADAEDLAGVADLPDPPAFNVHGAVRHDPEVPHLLPAAGSGPWAPEGDELGGVDDEQARARRCGGGTRRAGLHHLVRAPDHGEASSPRGSVSTRNAFPPAAWIAPRTSSGLSVSANMLPPPPAPVIFAP